MNRLSLALSLAAALPLFSAEPPPASSEKAEPAAATDAPARPKDEVMALFDKQSATPAIPSVDVGDFGTDDPIEREDLPTRGVITFPAPPEGYTNMDHWHQYDWKFKAKRWGHYQVRLTYKLDHATLGVQFKHGETRLKKTLLSSPSQRRAYLARSSSRRLAIKPSPFTHRRAMWVLVLKSRNWP